MSSGSSNPSNKVMASTATTTPETASMVEAVQEAAVSTSCKKMQFDLFRMKING
jgi:hypothetical protein